MLAKEVTKFSYSFCTGTFYRSQRSCKGYVFTPVCLSTGWGLPQCMLGYHPSPAADTPSGADPPPPQQTATVADGTHPTGMHYCMSFNNTQLKTQLHLLRFTFLKMVANLIRLIVVPKATPKDFQIDEDSLNATSAIFTWEGVPDNPDILQGHLIGYDVCALQLNFALSVAKCFVD